MLIKPSVGEGRKRDGVYGRAGAGAAGRAAQQGAVWAEHRGRQRSACQPRVPAARDTRATGLLQYATLPSHCSVTCPLPGVAQCKWCVSQPKHDSLHMTQTPSVSLWTLGRSRTWTK